MTDSLISHAKFLQRFYEQAGTTEQKTLSHIANVSSSAMSRIVNGASFPSPETLARIAVVCDVSIDYLVGLSDEPSPPGTRNSATRQALVDPVKRTNSGRPSPHGKRKN